MKYAITIVAALIIPEFIENVLIQATQTALHIREIGQKRRMIVDDLADLASEHSLFFSSLTAGYEDGLLH